MDTWRGYVKQIEVATGVDDFICVAKLSTGDLDMTGRRRVGNKMFASGASKHLAT